MTRRRRLQYIYTSVNLCISMHKPCTTERSGAEFRGTEHIFFEQQFRMQLRAQFSSQCGTRQCPSGHFEHSGGTGACPSGHFERSGGICAGSSGHFERYGGTGAGPSSHFERQKWHRSKPDQPFRSSSGPEASPKGHFERQSACVAVNSSIFGPAGTKLEGPKRPKKVPKPRDLKQNIRIDICI